MGILQRISSAASIEELNALNEELKTYKEAAPKTVRRAARLTSRKTRELKSAK